MTRLPGAFVLAGLLVGCQTSGPAPVPIPEPGDGGPWELVWSDEFEGAAGDAIDGDKWSFDLGGWGWGNNELQHYTDRTSNVRLNGEGEAVLAALREEYGGNAFTSARIKTADTFAHAYGRFEARIYLPRGRGIWPAFWMLGDDFDTAGWPDCGEIDVVELRGEDPWEIAGTVHGPGYSGGASVGGEFHVDREGEPFAENWHVYAVEWSEDEIRWMVDEQLYHSVIPGDLPEGADWVLDHPFFIILNVAVGGNFLLPPDEDTPFPARMGVDWVRVYQASE